MILALLWLAVIAGPTFAAEPDPVTRAKSLRDEATRALKRGKVADAVKALSAAQDLAPESSTALSLAKAYRKLGKAPAAANAYAAFLSSAPNNDPSVASVKSELARMDLKLARLRLVGPPGLTVRIDGSIVGRLPLEPVRVTPGLHDVLFESPDIVPVMKKIYAGAKLQVTVDVELAGFDAR